MPDQPRPTATSFAGGEPAVHFHSCDDCSTDEPWPGAEHDAFCVWNGLCFRCEVVHRNHCSCLGTNDGDGCSLQPAWVARA